VKKERWERIEIRKVGHVAEILRQGGGKVTVTTGDPGEPKKVPATE
jgi:hypothetical protein